MEEFNSFLNMGGYASFVWSSIGSTAFILILVAIISIRELRKREKKLKILINKTNDSDKGSKN
ncbi:MAG: heme exporter protein CcmD [Alphaproteobacteria bacterium]|nr:heme exporter protein CcmD [Alphaproteobacteria bacterium]|tara:strand:+ start:743 stop:931 length:189 start_codon:yes stop_codon:yes gene_type:complete